MSVDTIRRWERQGRLHGRRLDGRNRYFAMVEIDNIVRLRPLSTGQAATQLNLSVSTVRRLEHTSELVPQRSAGGRRSYSQTQVDEYRELHSSSMHEADRLEMPTQPIQVMQAEAGTQLPRGLRKRGLVTLMALVAVLVFLAIAARPYYMALGQ